MSRVVTHLLARDGSFSCKAANNSGSSPRKRATQALPGVMNGRCRYEIRISTKGLRQVTYFPQTIPAASQYRQLVQTEPSGIIQHSSVLQPLRIITAGEHRGWIMTNYVFYMSLRSSLCLMIYSGPGEPSLWVGQPNTIDRRDAMQSWADASNGMLPFN